MRVAVPLEQCWHEVPGGTASSALDLAAALHRRDDVEVVGVAARHREAPPPPWQPTVPMTHLRLPRPLLYEAWHALRRPRVESATGPVDICHAVGGAVPGRAAPLVFTVHDLAFLHHPELFTAQGRRFFRRALHLVRQEAAQVQVPSRATLEDCVTAGIERDRLRLVPWGVTVAAITEADIDDARRRFAIDRPTVVFVGTREPRKNMARLLEAWQLLAREDLQLVLVGPRGWGEAGVGDGRDASTLPENVTMTGFVDGRTRDALLSGAVVSCYPSLFEGFGLPVLESMALGCPVVTSTGTSTEELVTGGAGLAVDPRDPAAIADAIGSVVDDPALRARLSEAGRGRAAQHTWDRAASLAADGYREVLT